MTTEPQAATPAYSPSDAALEGLRLMRKRPGTILAWSGVYFLGLALIAGMMLLTLGPKFIDLARKGQFMLNDPERLGDALAGSWPAFFLVLLLTVLLSSIMTAGVFRLVKRPEEKGFAHLRVGRDEFRLVGANLILIAIGVAFLVAGFLITAVALQISPLAASLSGLGVVAACLYVGVRLALVTPLTFDTGKIALREGWALTRNRFWPLFGMVILAVVFYVLIVMLVGLIAIVIGELAGGDDAIAHFSIANPVAALAAIVLLVIQLVLQVLQIVMIYGPFSVTLDRFRSLGDAPPRPAAEPTGDRMPAILATYDEALSSWSGATSRAYHWAALGYWFLALLVYLGVMAALSLAAVAGAQGAVEAALAVGLVLMLPTYPMLLLSTVKRGRVLKIPGWLTAITAPIIAVTAIGYALAANRRP